MRPGPGWAEALESAARARTTVVLGGPDSGKTTLVAFLATGLWQRGHSTLVLDADVGQSEIGPPATLGLGRVAGPVARPGQIPWTALWFVGATSPVRHMACIVRGVRHLAARAGPDDRLVVDTGGLAAGPLGTSLKRRKLEALRPDLLIALERAGECGATLAACVAGGHPAVLRLPVGPEARVRSARERSRFRADAFAAYFATARPVELAVDAPEAETAALGAAPAVDGRILIALGDGDEVAGLGDVTGMSAGGRILSVLTPVPAARIGWVRAGSGTTALPVACEVSP